MDRGDIADFWGSETTLYDITVVDTCHTFVKSHRMYITKSEA